ncbi:hypothetical protein [Nocardioides plantarum]|uniref:Uncharacterized protein n=1 Tax=Nocardioides plantarum TaxID=29299 RepID=A0ABV5KF15_9ACTN|nr:hypothetical protein [Nocardioides plantarum]
MRQTPPSRTTVTLHELPAPAPSPAPAVVPVVTSGALPEREQVVFVTNAVRRRGGLRSRAEQQHHRPVLAVVVR